MKPKGILEIIRSGEDQSVEFKASFSTDVGNTICSFANTAGGIILLGVSDDGKIKGVPDKVEEQVASLAHSCKPSIYPKIRKEIHNGKLVIIVEVPHSEGVFAFFQECRIQACRDQRYAAFRGGGHRFRSRGENHPV